MKSFILSFLMLFSVSAFASDEYLVKIQCVNESETLRTTTDVEGILVSETETEYKVTLNGIFIHLPKSNCELLTKFKIDFPMF